MSYNLKSGDIIEIETSKNQTPNSGWLKFVKTSRAKHEISKYLRKIELEESIKIGNEILEKSLRKLKIFDRVNEFKKNYNGPNKRGTHYLIADKFEGPWSLAQGPYFTTSSEIELYAGRVIEKDNKFFFLAFLHDDQNGNFIGEISNPIPISFDKNGLMSLEI